MVSHKGQEEPERFGWRRQRPSQGADVVPQQVCAPRRLLGGERQHLAVELEDTDTLLQESRLTGPGLQQAPTPWVSGYCQGDPRQPGPRTYVDGRARR